VSHSDHHLGPTGNNVFLTASTHLYKLTKQLLNRSIQTSRKQLRHAGPGLEESRPLQEREKPPASHEDILVVQKASFSFEFSWFSGLTLSIAPKKRA
jgi:hypothetical protein